MKNDPRGKKVEEDAWERGYKRSRRNCLLVYGAMIVGVGGLLAYLNCSGSESSESSDASIECQQMIIGSDDYVSSDDALQLCENACVRQLFDKPLRCEQGLEDSLYRRAIDASKNCEF